MTWVHWAAFCAGTLVLLALDMFVFHRDSHEPIAARVGDVDGVLVRARAAVQFVAVVVGGADCAAGLAARAGVFDRVTSSNGRCRWTTCSCSW